MIGRLLSKEESNAALVVALSGVVAVLVARGRGPLAAGRLLSAVLSNPVPRTSGAAADAHRGAGFGDRRLRARH
jgi:hypothetical protein